MPYMNQPQDLFRIFSDMDSRLRKLETAVRFTAPNVSTVPAYPRVGDIVYNNTDDIMEYYDGSQWVILADNNLGTTMQTWNSTWAGTGLTYTGNPAVGKYMRVGKSIFYTITVDCTNVTNFGTGQYSLTLPTGLNPGYHFQHLGGLHKASTHYTLLADVEPGSNVVSIYHPTANGGQDPFTYNKPTVLTTASYFYISGTYFLA